MAFLQPVRMKGRHYILRELQASEDRLNLAALSTSPALLLHTLQSMGRLLAWAQLRSAGRGDAAGPDELMDFGQRSKWRPRLLELARVQTEQLRADFQLFAQAHDAGGLGV